MPTNTTASSFLCIPATSISLNFKTIELLSAITVSYTKQILIFGTIVPLVEWVFCTFVALENCPTFYA